MNQSFSLFGVKEQSKSNSILDVRIEEFSIKGYTVIPEVLTPDKLEYLRHNLDKLYESQVLEVGGEDALASINDSSTVRAPLVYDEAFLHLVAANPKVIEHVERVMGSYFILMLQNGVINQPVRNFVPNSYAFHRDVNYQHFVSSRPLAISALFCIDDFNESTGGTVVLPGTHKQELCPSYDFIQRNEVHISAEAGSVLLFDSMMYHRSGVNKSENIRRGVNNMYVAPFIKQQISFPSMLGHNYTSDPFLLQFLGYTSESDTSVVGFRQKRIDRLRDSQLKPKYDT
jgi:ectoine hydroxylase-related dioxygenase (phytanoyl-CoA dioxygenase family)